MKTTSTTTITKTFTITSITIWLWPNQNLPSSSFEFHSQVQKCTQCFKSWKTVWSYKIEIDFFRFLQVWSKSFDLTRNTKFREKNSSSQIR